MSSQDKPISNQEFDFYKKFTAASKELNDVLLAIDPEEIERICQVIAASGRIGAYGVGREGLMMKSLAMRLFHLGLDAHVIGDMTMPPLAGGDLLLISAGPGYFSTVEALRDTASKAGAKTLCFTSQVNGGVPEKCDFVLEVPAQTMASDQGKSKSILPMGSLYEGAQFVLFEIIILRVREIIDISFEDMRMHHTNME